MTTPLVSVLLPARDAAATIEAALTTIRRQTFAALAPKPTLSLEPARLPWRAGAPAARDAEAHA